MPIVKGEKTIEVWMAKCDNSACSVQAEVDGDCFPRAYAHRWVEVAVPERLLRPQESNRSGLFGFCSVFCMAEWALDSRRLDRFKGEWE